MPPSRLSAENLKKLVQGDKSERMGAMLNHSQAMLSNGEDASMMLSMLSKEVADSSAGRPCIFATSRLPVPVTWRAGAPQYRAAGALPRD